MSAIDNRVPDRAGAEPLSLRPIDQLVMDIAGERAREAPRNRFLLRYHDFPDPVQRMVNAIEPESYARPHRHLDPPKVEVFIVLRGKGVVVRFDDSGAVLEATTVSAAGPVHGVEIPPGAWHTVFALEPDTVFFEVKDGPYVQASDKDFAAWAPLEDDTTAAHRYLDNLRIALGFVPLRKLADQLMDAALDDDDLA